MNIGKIIKEERLKRDLTQEQFAQEFFVTRQLISKWETGKSYPDLEQVVQMSDWFDLPLDYLLKEDTKMLSDLSFDSKLKRQLKKGGIIFGLILLGGILTLVGMYVTMSQPLLFAKDIHVNKVEKVLLPEATVSHPTTKETWTLPEDVSYKIHFKTTKPFVNLPKYTGFVNVTNKDMIQILLGGGNWSLFGGNKDSTILIHSNREQLTPPELNIGKSIYLMNNNTTKGNPIEHVEQWSDKLFDWEELNEMPGKVREMK